MTSPQPVVTFIVPCYKLAHMLKECVDSILAQSYPNLEILILDDCSPDDTPAVAASYTDPRVRHIRHASNVGNIRNYNIGIQNASGKYLWRIDADDRLRSRTLVERYVNQLESDPNIVFAFCAGLDFDEHGVEHRITGVAAERDCVLSSDEFMWQIVMCNIVCTPSGMARTEDYLRIGLFSTELPHSADWFAWSLLGSFGPVAYYAEPGVNYRRHQASMSAQLIKSRSEIVGRDEIEVQWHIHRLCEGRTPALVAHSLHHLQLNYARKLIAAIDGLDTAFGESWFLQHSAARCAPALPASFQSAVFELAGDLLLEQQAGGAAGEMYAKAYALDASKRLRTKRILTALGPGGAAIRQMLSATKQALRGDAKSA